jgi:hypothetical protein
VGSELRFTDRGTQQLRGVDEPWQVFAVAEIAAPATAFAGPREHMRTRDRAIVEIARHAPGILRLGSRLAGSRG